MSLEQGRVLSMNTTVTAGSGEASFCPRFRQGLGKAMDFCA